MKSPAEELVFEDCARVAQEEIASLDALRKSTILISGGSGFMGCWLCEMANFLNEAHDAAIRVYVVARDKEKFGEKIGHIASRPWLEFIRCDVRNLVDLPRDVNYVIHAAATPDNRVHTSNPIETMVTIAEGTGALLKAADRVSNLRMLVNISSASVYGSQPPSLERIPEDYQGAPEGGDAGSAYGEAKRYAETLCTAARSEARLPVVTLRPFAFLGAYQPLDAPWAINNFMSDALSERSIRILGDGKTVRSLMYGADMALWILKIMTRTRTGRVYNLGSDQGITLDRLAWMVAKQFRPEPEIILNASMAGTVPRSVLVPDIGLAKRDFGLTLYTDVETAIKRTIQWHRLGQDRAGAR